MNKYYHLLIKFKISLLFLALAGPANSALVMHIDTTAEEVFFTGSDTGVTSSPSFPAVVWRNGNFAGSTIDITGLLTASITPFRVFPRLQLGTSGRQIALSFLSTDGNSPVTINGTGTRTSYAAATAGQKLGLANQIGNPINSLFPGNIGSLSVVAATSPVPLPAAAWLFGSAVLGVFGVGARKDSKITQALTA